MNPEEILLTFAVFALVIVGYPAANAEEQVERIVFDNVTETFPILGCSDVGGTTTITYDGFLDTVMDGQGGFHSTRVRVGNFTTSLVSGVTYVGSFFDQFAVYGNRLTDPDRTTSEVTLIMMGTGSDGSRLNFRSIDHDTTNMTGFRNFVEYIWCAGERIGG